MQEGADLTKPIDGGFSLGNTKIPLSYFHAERITIKRLGKVKVFANVLVSGEATMVAIITRKQVYVIRSEFVIEIVHSKDSESYKQILAGLPKKVLEFENARREREPDSISVR